MRRLLAGAGAVPAVLLLPALAFSVWLLRSQQVPLQTPDSDSYIAWAGSRPVGYPLFLAALAPLDPTLEVVRYVQLALFAGCALFLGATVHRVLGPAWPGGLVAGLTLFNVPLARMSLSIVTESLFCSLLMLHLAAVLRLLERRSPARWSLVGLSAFAAILVRPAGMSLLAAAPMLALIPPRDLRGFVKWLLVPVAAAWLCAAGANAAWRGSFGLQELGGVSVIGHVALLLDEQGSSEFPELRGALASELRPHRLAASERHAMDERFLFSTIEYNTMLGMVMRRIRGYAADTRRLPQDLASLRADAAVNRIAGRLSVEAIREHWPQYGIHVASHLYGFWRMPQFKTPEDYERLRHAYQERYPASRAIPEHAERFFTFVNARPRVLVVLKDLAMAGALSISVFALLLPLVIGLGDRRVSTMAYASLNLHAALVLVALTQAALWRYSIVWAPFAVVMVTTFALWCVSAVRKPGLALRASASATGAPSSAG